MEWRSTSNTSDSPSLSVEKPSVSGPPPQWWSWDRVALLRSRDVEDDTIISGFVESGRRHPASRNGSPAPSDLEVCALRVILSSTYRASLVKRDDLITDHVIACLERFRNGYCVCVVGFDYRQTVSMRC